MIFCFDLDNVICETSGTDYSISKPHKEVIKKINSLYEEGNKIIIFTARYMGRNNENVELAINQGFVSTEKQLKNWGLKFNKLIFGKPVYDVYVDDKNFEFKKDWIKEFSKKY
jgi:CMP-N,N'-diacetyllegionaminic acid synthase